MGPHSDPNRLSFDRNVFKAIITPVLWGMGLSLGVLVLWIGLSVAVLKILLAIGAY